MAAAQAALQPALRPGQSGLPRHHGAATSSPRRKLRPRLRRTSKTNGQQETPDCLPSHPGLLPLKKQRRQSLLVHQLF